MDEYLIFSEVLLALLALQIRFALVHIQMLLLIRYLVECHVTSVDRAFKWFFPGVNSNMVKQIVPFPEKFAAPLVVAGEHFRDPSCLDARVLDEGVSIGTGHMHFHV